jgi:hypothetical protein
MPDLLRSLQNHDLAHLRILAGEWGVDLRSTDKDSALQELCTALLDPKLFREILDALPLESRQALEVILDAGGRFQWAVFSRQFGDLREAGPGRRDREQIFLHPISTSELLFYRAFVARAFFDTPNGLQEFAYIPDDLLKLIPARTTHALSLPIEVKPLGRPATPRERSHIIPTSDRILDDATTLLAALRMDKHPPKTFVPADVVGSLLRSADILAGNEPRAEKTKAFLEMPRGQALSMLAETWRSSEFFNELRLIPGLVCEGEWTNSPLTARRLLLGLLDAIPHEKWWSLPAFVQDIKEKYPDFQRPVGDYDSWFVKRRSDDLYLRGFQSWDEVDGALIQFLITGPLFWLGLLELAAPEEGETGTAFRRVGQKRITQETGKLTVSSNGLISVPRLVPRSARYLVARFCDWEDARPDEYRYRVSTRSLQKAVGQGLKVTQLLGLLSKNSLVDIPSAFVKALKRWDLNGTEARVETQTILRLNRPETLEELRKSKAGRFLGESLGPVTVVVKKGAQSRVLAALAEMGLLAEDEYRE